MFIEALFTISRTWKKTRCQSTNKWIKKLWCIYTKEYYSAIKRNTFESVLMRWMNLEPITSKLEREKQILYINAQKIDSRKMVLMNLFICKAAMETQTQRIDLWNRLWGWEGKGRTNGESSMETYTLPYVKEITSGKLLYDTVNSNQGSMTIQRGGMGWQGG